MAATFVNNLRVAEPADGDADWGTTTNTSLELIGEALGIGSEAIVTNADTHTSTVADGATDPARALHLQYTGTLDSTSVYYHQARIGCYDYYPQRHKKDCVS